jgi:hypothetical protein
VLIDRVRSHAGIRSKTFRAWRVAGGLRELRQAGWGQQRFDRVFRLRTDQCSFSWSGKDAVQGSH